MPPASPAVSPACDPLLMPMATGPEGDPGAGQADGRTHQLLQVAAALFLGDEARPAIVAALLDVPANATRADARAAGPSPMPA